MTSVHKAVMLYGDHLLKSVQPTIKEFFHGSGWFALATLCQAMMMTCKG